MGALLNGLDSDVWLAAATSIALGAAEACTDSGDHTIYWANTHKAWDKDKTLTVQCSPNGTSGWVTVTDYTFDWPLGRITFNTPRGVGVTNFVRINAGSYFNVSQVDECHAWSLSQKADISDTTPFQAAGGFKRKTLTKKDASGSVDLYRTDDLFFLELGSRTVIRLYIDKSASIALSFYALVTGIDPKSDSSGVSEQSVSFECDGPVLYTTTV